MLKITKKVGLDYSQSQATVELVEQTNARVGELPFGVETLESLVARATLMPVLGKYALHELSRFSEDDELGPLYEVFRQFDEGTEQPIEALDANVLIKALCHRLDLEVSNVSGYEVRGTPNLGASPNQVPRQFSVPDCQFSLDAGLVTMDAQLKQTRQDLSTLHRQTGEFVGQIAKVPMAVSLGGLPASMLNWIVGHYIRMQSTADDFPDGVKTLNHFSPALIDEMVRNSGKHGPVIRDLVARVYAMEIPNVLSTVRAPRYNEERTLWFMCDAAAYLSTLDKEIPFANALLELVCEIAGEENMNYFRGCTVIGNFLRKTQGMDTVVSRYINNHLGGRRYSLINYCMHSRMLCDCSTQFNPEDTARFVKAVLGDSDDVRRVICDLTDPSFL